MKPQIIFKRHTPATFSHDHVSCHLVANVLFVTEEPSDDNEAFFQAQRKAVKREATKRPVLSSSSGSNEDAVLIELRSIKRSINWGAAMIVLGLAIQTFLFFSSSF